MGRISRGEGDGNFGEENQDLKNGGDKEFSEENVSHGLDNQPQVSQPRTSAVLRIQTILDRIWLLLESDL